MKTQTWFQGDVGHHYYEETRVKDAQGNMTTQREKKTRWQRGSGWRNGEHRDVLACASKGVDRSLVVAIEPWDMKGRQPYTPQFLAGWEAERYGLESEDAWTELGKPRVEKEEQQECERKLQADYKGDTTRSVSISVRYSDLRSRHMLLPAYISAYTYEGKTFRFMINGQTGEVQGERPYSALKIVLFIAAIIAIIGAIAGVASIASSGKRTTTTPTTQPR